MSSLTNHFYSFGDFAVDSSQRVLLFAGKPVALTPKAFDTLLILLEGGGRIVEKEDLKRRLWPNTFVEEANITFNIQQLRKALGDDARNPRFVETVARRGYRFIAPVEVRVVEQDEPAADASRQNVEQPTDVAQARAKRGKGKTLTFGLIALAVLAIGGVIIWKVLSAKVGERAGAALEAATKAKVKVEQLTVTGQSHHVAISPDGKYVAYERVFENKAGIWLRQLEANTNVELVPPSGSIYGVAFNHSGDYVYFVRGNPTTALYRVSLVGGPPTKLVDQLEGNFSISSDNNQIAFVRALINAQGQREYSLITVNPDGTGERVRLSGVHPDGIDTPIWTRDGKSIICSYGNTTGGSQDVRLIEVSLDDGQKKELSSKKFFRIRKMAWLANYSGLLLSARTTLGENDQLWRLSYPGMDLTQLTEGVVSYGDLSLTGDGAKGVASHVTLTSDIWVGSSRDPNTLKRVTQATGNFSWSPDGRLVYSSTASGNRDLWIMQRDGRDQRQLTVDHAMDVGPRVTPDNRYIIFISNRTGEFQVWRMNIDGTNQIQLTSGGPKNHISVSPDNRWVFYNTTDDWHLWKTSIDGGEPVKVADYVAMLASMSPDEKTIVCIGRDGARRVLLVLPATGGPPVKRIDLPQGMLIGYRIEWTPDGKSLICMVDRDGPISLYKVPLDGGQPQELAKFDQDELFDFDYSADGQFLAVTRGGWFHDVVLLSDLGQ